MFNSLFLYLVSYYIFVKQRVECFTVNCYPQFACKVVAMGLHYWWVCALAWCACDAWQLRRLVRELRDVNHGPLCAQLAAAYAAPAVALALAAAQHQHQYGNALL